MRILDWPKEDRPREKLLAKGGASLTNAELIAIFLNNGTPGKTALDIAKALLHEFGSLKQLFRATPNEVIQKPGIGPAKYAALCAAIELGKRFITEQVVRGMTLNHPKLVYEFLLPYFNNKVHETFACLFLDSQLRLIAYEELFHGTIDEACVYPREIVRRGMMHNAAKIILAHNHPSGASKPSFEDKQLTMVIGRALSLIDMQVIDHIILGEKEYFSFNERGLIASERLLY